MPRVTDTRRRLLEVAEAHFADKGFEATSLRDIGGVLSIANSSLLHHFASKRKLYGAVLARIADSLEDLDDRFDADCRGDDAALLVLAELFFAWAKDHPRYVRIIARELLDNAEHVESVRHWHLEPIVQRLAERIGRGNPKRDPVVAIMHVVGAISYVFVGLPTIGAMTGCKPHALLHELARELPRYYAT